MEMWMEIAKQWGVTGILVAVLGFFSKKKDAEKTALEEYFRITLIDMIKKQSSLTENFTLAIKENSEIQKELLFVLNNKK